MDAHAMHGLEYPSGLLESLRTLDDVVSREPNGSTKPTALDSSSSLNTNIDSKEKKADASNIYLLPPSAFSQLHESHLMNPPPEDVLFPFLHGLEGGNQALSGFFLGGGVGASSSARRKVTVPRYRGLMWVICEDDLDNPEKDLKCLVHPQDHELGIYGLTPPDYDEDSDGYFSSEDDLDDLDDEDTSSESASTEDINNLNNSAAMDVDVAINDSNSPVHDNEDLDETTYMHPVSHRPAPMKPIVNTRDLPVDMEAEMPTSSSFASTTSDVDMGMAVDVESAPVLITETSGAKSRRERKRSQSQPPQTAPPILTCSFRPHELLKRVPRTAPVSGKEEKSGSGADFERGGRTETVDAPTGDVAVEVKVEMNEEDVQFLVSAGQEDNQLEEWSAQDPDWEYHLTPLAVPDGISLRNFGCQVAILASMSDIVVYSPSSAGAKSVDARKLARRFREALERKRRERILRGHPPNLLPTYNVFLLDAGAEEIRKEAALSSLSVKVKEGGAGVGRLGHATENKDGDYFGNLKEDSPLPSLPPGNTVDFAQREREEMRELTRASEIVRVRVPSPKGRSDTKAEPILEGKIWLGNVNDVPLPVDTYSSHPNGGIELEGLEGSEIEIREWERLAACDSSSANPPSNPLGFDICIECHETAPLPGKEHVRMVEERISLFEAAWRAHSSRDGRKHAPRPPPTASNIIHLPFSSSPVASASCARDVQGIVKWLGALVGIGEDWEEVEGDAQEENNKRLSSPAPASPQTQTHTPASSSWSSFLPLPTFSWASGKEPPTTPTTASTTPPTNARTRSFTSPASSSIPYSAPHLNAKKGKAWSRPLKILVYSSDGYTESSVFGLCLLMGLGQYRARGAPIPKPTIEAEVEERGMSLPEAYLQLQLGDQRPGPGEMTGRSFFVYHGDLTLLRKVDGELERERREKREMKELRDRQEREREKRRQSAGAEGGDKRRGSLSKAAMVGKTGILSTFGTNVNPYTAGGWTGRPSAKSVSFNMPGTPPPMPQPPSTPVDVTSSPPTPTPPPQEGTASSSMPSIISSQATMAPLPSLNRVRPSASRPRSSTMFSYSHGGGAGVIPPYLGGGDSAHEHKLRRKFFNEAWFNDARFDGSFPSRVLEGVYLGNLNHASNVYMLQALGITHVVSVGECALVPPNVSSHPFYPNQGHPHTPPHLQNPHPNNIHSAPPTPGSLFLEEKAGRIKVLDIQGVCDDGIDTLSHHTLDGICAWIQRARDEGGEVLVHCRVGVSRSATVVIAYVMKSLGLPLVDAYLIVRSRRLSVLIQPNMRLLYGLCGWEVKLAMDRAKAAIRGDVEEENQNQNEVLRRELSTVLTWPYLAKEVHRLNEKYLG